MCPCLSLPNDGFLHRLLGMLCCPTLYRSHMSLDRGSRDLRPNMV